MSVQFISAVSKIRDRIVGVMVGVLSSSKTVWFEIKIMFHSGATCLPADCCFSEQAQWKSN